MRIRLKMQYTCIHTTCKLILHAHVSKNEAFFKFTLYKIIYIMRSLSGVEEFVDINFTSTQGFLLEGPCNNPPPHTFSVMQFVIFFSNFSSLNPHTLYIYISCLYTFHTHTRLCLLKIKIKNCTILVRVVSLPNENTWVIHRYDNRTFPSGTKHVSVQYTFYTRQDIIIEFDKLFV